MDIVKIKMKDMNAPFRGSSVPPRYYVHRPPTMGLEVAE
jgi:hypothetical protein